MTQTQPAHNIEREDKLYENQIATRLVTAKEIAMRLHIDDKKVYRMVNSGEIPGIKVGGQWRFEMEVVLSTLKQGSANGIKGS